MSRVEKGVEREAALSFTVDGETLTAFPGETVAGALTAAAHLRLRDDRSAVARGLFCNMGTCSECFMWVSGEHGWRRRRACLLPVTAGLTIATREPGTADER